MKKLIIFFLLVACHKKEVELVPISVRDAIDNSLVKDARVDLFYCGPGCQAYPYLGLDPVQTGTSGAGGTCFFSRADFIKASSIQALKEGYIGNLIPKSISISIYPMGWIRLHVSCSTNYPPMTKLRFSFKALQSGHVDSHEYEIPADSSLLLPGFGGQMNRIVWYVTTPLINSLNSGTWDQQVPRLDTVKNITLIY